ncbi:MAG: Type IV fimbrial assembly, ATPase PilB [uncultured Thiotrichaceae bacterium]|uniref:Type IV fimbrial assembly, ATPase PilB n=1 Tax=uncultured Thiotrichaceae bacterium TaxID=298394 RepID=A0A6S6TIF6_9GAMM|nr:MAG: Type IV fimbrial assembly, ATPase PilB [uncultured Thiotrichaceae bacterium]
MVTSVSSFPGYVKQLVNSGIIELEAAERAVKEAHTNHSSILEWFFRNRLATATELAQAVGEEYGLSTIDIDAIDIRPDVADLITDDQKERLKLLPLYRYEGFLMVALADPVCLTNMDDVKFATGLQPYAVIVEYDKLGAHLNAGSGFSGSAASSGMSVSTEAITQNIALDTQELKKNDDAGGEEIEITGFVDKLLAHAINSKVSDIHIEPYEKNLRIRYRVDGILKVIATPPISIASRLTSRIKVLGRMNISERRVPQDGRVRFKLNEKKNIDFRVNTLPTIYGEKVVMRILDSDSATIGIEKLGFDPKQQSDFMDALAKPDGMVLVTGPTGSGKTVTLYTGLGMLNTPERNISTAEDPVEINMPGVNQVNVNPKVGLTFADALRAFLRQDPDIIMVGEIRDLETAEISIKAAQTGHLVLSTLHTNSAPETLTRLLNMGVPPFNIASSVQLIIAQRLARRLCEHCKKRSDIPEEALLDIGFKEDELSKLKVYEAVGCSKCSQGYKGRVGIYEAMPISAAMGRMVMDGANSLDIADQAQKEGVKDLRQSGLEKVRQGVTSITELERITKD